MKALNIILSVLKNKYLLAIAVFVVMLIFVDKNDVFVQVSRKQQLKELTDSRDFYLKEIEKTKKELADLQNNPAALEKYARENLYMKKSNEDIFIVETPVDSLKK
ncbi:septum formation initiator family protein [Danxiaibacter flavus]|uniref:Septum formation initiator family protein n=1 Tax=Danxiaibacter flavus TaxID=3049108 RepID=A0ABV3ZGF0_9BACT|nr:septum formation initiator family protein [Chitinophagaceae bacterium DXS]